MATQPQPPGWYPDPQGQGQRWWDGTRWTEHVTGAAPPTQGGPGPSASRPRDQAAARTCPACGQGLDSSHRFCPTCGAVTA